MKRCFLAAFWLVIFSTVAAAQTAPLTITSTPTLPAADLCVASPTVTCSSYSFTFTATGGTTPYTWDAPSGLPAGMALNSGTGVLSGIPTSSVVPFLIIQVTDPSEGFDSQEPTLQINPQPSITTTSLPGGVVGSFYTVTLAATGGTTPYVWSLASAPSTLPPGIAIDSTGAITGTPTAPGTYTPTIQMTDSAGGGRGGATIVTATLTLNVLPAFVITSPSTLPSTDACTPSATIICSTYSFAFTSTGGTAPVSWSISSGAHPGLTIDPATGILSGNPPSPESFTVFASDASERSAFLSVNVPVNPQPSITTTSLPGATQGVSYSTTLAAKDGTPPFVWSASSTLPAGLLLSSGGVLSGTPSASGTFTVNVQAKDAAGTSVLAALPLTIVAGLSITPATLPPGTVGASYSFTFTGSGGTPSYQWSISPSPSSLPPGLNLNTATGALTGTPTATGNFPFTIVLTDSAERTTSLPQTITVGSIAITSSSNLPNGTVNSSYTFTFTSNAGAQNGAVSWSIASGSAPPGLSLNSSSGVLSGTPSSAGAFSFTVKVTDSFGRNASALARLTVVTGFKITSVSPLTPGVAGIAYSQQLTASGGVGKLTWSATNGTLPAGVTLSSSGLLSGTPSKTGTFSFTVQATDSSTPAPQVATAPFLLTINKSSVQITTASPLPSGQVGVHYATQLAVSGAVAPLVWSVAAGSLPDGLQLDAATGLISGSPKTQMAATFTIQVTDAVASVAIKQFGLTIGLPAVTLSVTGLDTVPANSQPAPQLTLSAPFPADITGTATLTFASAVGADDGMIRFINPDPGDPAGRTFTFTIPAGQTQPQAEPQFMVGTTAGTITLTIVLSSQGQTLAPAPPPVPITIASDKPQIVKLTATRNANGLTVLVTGFCTARQVTKATFQFAGTNLQTSSFTLDLTSAFNAWYQNQSSIATGTAFTLTQPFTVQGDPASVTSVTVVLTGPQGDSASKGPQNF